MARVSYLSGAGSPHERRRLVFISQACAAFLYSVPSSGAGIDPKIKPAPSVVHACATHAGDLRHAKRIRAGVLVMNK